MTTTTEVSAADLCRGDLVETSTGWQRVWSIEDLTETHTLVYFANHHSVTVAPDHEFVVAVETAVPA